MAEQGQAGGSEKGSLIRTLVADDSQVTLDALASYLREQGHFDVVGEAHDGQEATEMAALLEPELVLIDLTMPRMNGIEACRMIKSWAKPPRVIILTLHDDAFYRSSALAANADGFVSKLERARKLVPLITQLFPDRL